MEMASHTCLGHCEIDKYADKSYRAMHDVKESEWFATDITRVRSYDIPKADAWCFGFPCQDISIAGNQGGFTAGKRSSLFFAVTRLIRDTAEENRPGTLFIENVKNLLSINRGIDFAKLLIELDEIGYDAEWDVLNTAEVLPQNRERVFVIGHSRRRSTRKVFPIGQDDTISDVEKFAKEGQSQTENCGTALRTSGTMKADSTYIKVIGYSGSGDPMFALTAQDRHGVMICDTYNHNEIKNGICGTLTAGGNTSSMRCGTFGISNGNRVRRLLPIECFRLQGFPDEYFYRAQAVNSDSRLYQQAGNSVSVPVIYEIAKRL